MQSPPKGLPQQSRITIEIPTGSPQQTPPEPPQQEAPQELPRIFREMAVLYAESSLRTQSVQKEWSALLTTLEV